MRRLYKLYTILIVFIAVTQISCSSIESPISIAEEATPVSMTGHTESAFTVYTKHNDYKANALEPYEGCYIGAYVLSNKQIDCNIIKYDEMTEKVHAISVNNMRLGERFPYEWVLECIATKKTPYIFVLPPNEYAYFQDELLSKAAKDFSELNVPIFVDFYPNPHKYTNDSDMYKEYYKKAYDTFKLNAPNTIFVLSVDSENVYDCEFYYPGDEYVDWVGLSIYVPLYKNGTEYLRGYLKDLDYFYSAFQRKKPIVLNQVAFSSYSTKNHRYFSNESAKKLSDFYMKIKNEYTRIKAVNYMDINNIEGAPKNAERDNFSVTQNDIMLKSYKNVIGDSYFLSETEINEETEKMEIFKSYYPVLEDEINIYISERVFTNDLLKEPNISPVVINAENYYIAEQLVKSDINCVIDYDLKRIYLDYSKITFNR